MKRVVAVLLLVSVSGCFTRELARKNGRSGWFRADAVPSAPDAYDERIEPLPIEGVQFDCDVLRARQKDEQHPLIVLVHGIGGDGPELDAALRAVLAGEPASVFLFRWVPYDTRDATVSRLAIGLNRIAHCLPDPANRLIVLAHSAGGIIVSHAASIVREPMIIFTVASPLAGVMKRAPNEGGAEEATLMLDVGSSIESYPPAVPGVLVVHLRTQPPGDPVMTPKFGRVPNDPKIGVPGAAQLDLPKDLDHNGALLYVAKKLADGTYVEWLKLAVAP